MANVNRSCGSTSFAARRIRFSGFATLALIAGAGLVMLIHTPIALLDAPAVYAIKDAQIVTGAGKTIAKGTVVFRDGLITEVGENV